MQRLTLPRRRTWIIILLACAIVPVARISTRVAHGWTLLMRAADRRGFARTIADLDTTPISESRLEIPIAGGPIAARLYQPVRASRHTVLLVPGLHPGGIEEPRFVALARILAEARVTVVTPAFPGLEHFEITPQLTDQIEQAATWVAVRSGIAPSGRIGLMGVSFGGGLAIVAAGRPVLRGHLLYVLSVGGHDDLGQVLQYFCGGPPRSFESGPAPHDFGPAVVLLNAARDLVPAEQVSPLHQAILLFLSASYLDGVDTAAAQRDYASARAFEPTLGEPAATLLHFVNERDVAQLGRHLASFVNAIASNPALSPALSAAPTAPVYLLHGRDDNVIPADESRRLAARLGPRNTTLLITGILSHVDAEHQVGVFEATALAHFWGDILAR